MTGPEHYARAEEKLQEGDFAAAKVHAALALAAAVAMAHHDAMLADDRQAWIRLAGAAPEATRRRGETQAGGAL